MSMRTSVLIAIAAAATIVTTTSDAQVSQRLCQFERGSGRSGARQSECQWFSRRASKHDATAGLLHGPLSKRPNTTVAHIHSGARGVAGPPGVTLVRADHERFRAA